MSSLNPHRLKVHLSSIQVVENKWHRQITTITTISYWTRFCKLVTRCNRLSTYSRGRYVVCYARMLDGYLDLNSCLKPLLLLPCNKFNTIQLQYKNNNMLSQSNRCWLKKQISDRIGLHKKHNLMRNRWVKGQRTRHKGSFLCIRSKSWPSRALGKPLWRTRIDFRRNRRAGAVTIW